MGAVAVKPTGCTAAAGSSGAAIWGSGKPLRSFTQSGFNVATTNSNATATVTAWEKMSQVLRMEKRSMAARGAIETYLNDLLAVGRFRDYGPNGLQVEGKAQIVKLVSGVVPSSVPSW